MECRVSVNVYVCGKQQLKQSVQFFGGIHPSHFQSIEPFLRSHTLSNINDRLIVIFLLLLCIFFSQLLVLVLVLVMLLLLFLILLDISFFRSRFRNTKRSIGCSIWCCALATHCHCAVAINHSGSDLDIVCSLHYKPDKRNQMVKNTEPQPIRN